MHIYVDPFHAGGLRKPWDGPAMAGLGRVYLRHHQLLRRAGKRPKARSPTRISTYMQVLACLHVGDRGPGLRNHLSQTLFKALCIIFSSSLDLLDGRSDVHSAGQVRSGLFRRPLDDTYSRWTVKGSFVVRGRMFARHIGLLPVVCSISLSLSLFLPRLRVISLHTYNQTPPFFF